MVFLFCPSNSEVRSLQSLILLAYPPKTRVAAVLNAGTQAAAPGKLEVGSQEAIQVWGIGPVVSADLAPLQKHLWDAKTPQALFLEQETALTQH